MTSSIIDKTRMEQITETVYAKQMLPVLEKQLDTLNIYNKQFNIVSGYDVTCPPLLTMIGETELKIALANAMIFKAELEMYEQRKQWLLEQQQHYPQWKRYGNTRKSKPRKSKIINSQYYNTGI